MMQLAPPEGTSTSAIATQESSPIPSPWLRRWSTRRRAARFTFEEIGPVTLKGVAEPVTVFSALGHP